MTRSSGVGRDRRHDDRRRRRGERASDPLFAPAAAEPQVAGDPAGRARRAPRTSRGASSTSRSPPRRATRSRPSSTCPTSTVEPPPRFAERVGDAHRRAGGRPPSAQSSLPNSTSRFSSPSRPRCWSPTSPSTQPRRCPVSNRGCSCARTRRGGGVDAHRRGRGGGRLPRPPAGRRRFRFIASGRRGAGRRRHGRRARDGSAGGCYGHAAGGWRLRFTRVRTPRRPSDGDLGEIVFNPSPSLKWRSQRPPPRVP